MGGHGTWQFGVHFPGRFAVVGPSAGWSSFYSYSGRSRPRNPFDRSQRSSETNDFLSNLARRGVYILHGGADDNVPTREGRDMYTNMMGITDELTYHEEPGVGHWWNGDRSEGVDCVDWPPLFDLMQRSRLDPTELDFEFICASPRVNPTHSYVTIRSAASPYADVTLASEATGTDTLSLTTTNSRSLVLDGDALMARGIREVTVDGVAHDVAAGDITIGPQDGKTDEIYGPFNQVFARPFCFLYPDEGGDEYRAYAAFLLSRWQLIGNGQGCAMPLSELSDELRREYNLIFMGATPEVALAGSSAPLSWDNDGVTLSGRNFESSNLAAVYRSGDRLNATIVTTGGQERALYSISVFHSGFALPDFLIWNGDGSQGAGFFTPDWSEVASR
jgi:hypothetical protein